MVRDRDRDRDRDRETGRQTARNPARAIECNVRMRRMQRGGAGRKGGQSTHPSATVAIKPMRTMMFLK